MDNSSMSKGARRSNQHSSSAEELAETYGAYSEQYELVVQKLKFEILLEALHSELSVYRSTLQKIISNQKK